MWKGISPIAFEVTVSLLYTYRAIRMYLYEYECLQSIIILSPSFSVKLVLENRHFITKDNGWPWVFFLPLWHMIVQSHRRIVFFEKSHNLTWSYPLLSTVFRFMPFVLTRLKCLFPLKMSCSHWIIWWLWVGFCVSIKFAVCVTFSVVAENFYFSFFHSSS